ncbi:MAG TPA: fused MFS/spermidine synthase, partial [Solirubrobacteraceae bacterium]
MSSRTKRARQERRRAGRVERHAERSAPACDVGLPRALGAAFLLSGSAGLVHEMVWVRRLGFVFGVSEMAIATVLAAFMGGLAIGSWVVATGRLGARDGRRIYAWLEIGIGLAALLVPVVLVLVGPVYGWLWRRSHLSFAALSVVRLLVAAAVLLPPTILMGATFPLLAGYLRIIRARHIPPQWLYTLNLAGAVLGVAAAGFLLLPLLGVRATMLVAAFSNVAIGIWVLRLRAPAADLAASREAPAVMPIADRPRRLLVAAAFLSGLVSLATQVAWSRVLALVVGSTTYAFTSVLLVYLVALGTGSAWAAYRSSRVAHVGVDLALMHLASALLLLASLAFADRLPYLYLRLYDVWPPGAIAGGVARSLATALVLLVPSVAAAGTLLPLVLAATLPAGADAAAPAVGRIYAMNTLGAIAGAVLAGFLLIPQLGTQGTLRVLAVATAAMGLALAFARPRPRWLAPGAAVAAGLAALAALTLPPWNQRDLNISVSQPGLTAEAIIRDRTIEAIYQREGPTASVVVFRHSTHPARILSMSINGRANASDYIGDLGTQVTLAQLPLLLAPRMDRVFIVGWGSGVTVGSATRSPAREITAVELEPAVVEASRLFEHVNNHPGQDPRVRLYVDDARHILLASTDVYDVIVSEPPHAWVTGVANLFTRDFYALAASRLEPDGVFAQWLQTYQISWDAYRSILASFQSVFPEVMV